MPGREKLIDPLTNPGSLRREGAASAEGGGTLEGAERRRFCRRLRGLHRDGAVWNPLLANLLWVSLIAREAT